MFGPTNRNKVNGRPTGTGWDTIPVKSCTRLFGPPFPGKDRPEEDHATWFNRPKTRGAGGF